MKRTLRTVLIVVGLLLLAYSWSWIAVYLRSLANYRYALAELEGGKVALALKGGRVLEPGGDSYRNEGGLQAVVEVWESPWAVPRPALYAEALAKLKEAIADDLDEATGLALIRQYARLDRRLLDLVALRVASFYEEEGRLDEARGLYGQALELFPQDKELATKVAEGLARLDVRSVENTR